VKTINKLSMTGAAVLLLTLAACGSSTSDAPVAPTVVSTTPAASATNVAYNAAVSVTFSGAMDPASLTGATFTLTSGAVPVAVSGAVTSLNSKATFQQASDLASDTLYTATVTTGARNTAGTALEARHTWTFRTAVAVVPPVAPVVSSTTPVAGATLAPLNGNVSATFSKPMVLASISTASFKVTVGTPAVAVPGTVVYADSKAVFWPSSLLLASTVYTATITTAATDTDALHLAADHTWTFTTRGAVLVTLPVNLGTAGSFAILAKSAISTVPTSAITGDIGVSPAAATYITGFALTADATNVFSTSTQVTGKVFASDFAVPTPANMTASIGDMELAYTDAAGRAADVTELGAGDIGGGTLFAGVYKWGTGLLIPTDVTLTGSATEVWIFQIAQDLTIANGIRVHLTGGALAKNVFWQVAGIVSLGTTSHLEGVVLTQTAITLATGATVNGRLLAQTAVSLDASTVVQPAP
jgi:hypothetical protein